MVVDYVEYMILHDMDGNRVVRITVNQLLDFGLGIVLQYICIQIVVSCATSA